MISLYARRQPSSLLRRPRCTTICVTSQVTLVEESAISAPCFVRSSWRYAPRGEKVAAVVPARMVGLPTRPAPPRCEPGVASARGAQSTPSVKAPTGLLTVSSQRIVSVRLGLVRCGRLRQTLPKKNMTLRGGVWLAHMLPFLTARVI